MTSTRLMLALLVFYVAILAASLAERHWWRALYWLGAVLGMTWKRT